MGIGVLFGGEKAGFHPNPCALRKSEIRASADPRGTGGHLRNENKVSLPSTVDHLSHRYSPELISPVLGFPYILQSLFYMLVAHCTGQSAVVCRLRTPISQNPRPKVCLDRLSNML